MTGRKGRVPEGYRTVTPQLYIRGCAAAIEFYKKAFGAKELLRHSGPDGKSIIHARLRIGDSIVLVNDEAPTMGGHSPSSLGGTTVTINLYVEDADALFAAAVAAGAEVTMPLQDMFWGDRFSQVRDPFGHNWTIGTRIEDVSPEESRARAAKYFSGSG